MIDTERETRSRGSNTTVVGAVVELEVAADLMSKGFVVYRNMSPTGPVDMVAIAENGRVRKIQATRGRVGIDGLRTFANHKDQPNWDVLAVRFPEGVHYYSRRGNQLALDGRVGEQTSRALSLLKRKKRMVGPRVAQTVTGIESARFKEHSQYVPLPGQPGVEVRAWGPAFLEATRPNPMSQAEAERNEALASRALERLLAPA